MNKQFLAVILVVVAALFGVATLTNNKKDTGGNGGQNSSQTKASEHTVGAGNKKVTLIEYGDFECPACGQYYPLVKEVKQAYGDDIKFQFRNFPLTSLHPNAMAGHRAAEAAGKQGKFFEMHDLLYENQNSWNAQSGTSFDAAAKLFESYAQQLGLNIEQFKTDVKSEETLAIINVDIKEGQAIGANSTPTFVLNGRKLEENPRSLDDFKKLIDEEIAKVSR